MSLSFSGPGLWYATRATGLVTLLLLTAAVVLGILTAARIPDRYTSSEQSAIVQFLSGGPGRPARR